MARLSCLQAEAAREHLVARMHSLEDPNNAGESDYSPTASPTNLRERRMEGFDIQERVVLLHYIFYASHNGRKLREVWRLETSEWEIGGQKIGDRKIGTDLNYAADTPYCCLGTSHTLGVEMRPGGRDQRTGDRSKKLEARRSVQIWAIPPSWATRC